MNNDAILIVGTGALATLFAARFAKAGISVTMLGTWQEGLEELNKKGVQVEGEERAYPVHATDNPADCMGLHHALVLVKAWQTKRAAKQLSSCLPADGLALTLQNGLGNEAILSSVLGKERVALGVTTMGATLISPGVSCLGGEGPVSLDPQPGNSQIQKLLRQAGIGVNVVDNLPSLIWGKLVVSSAINPLSALLRIKNGELLERSTARTLMGNLARETAGVAKSLGIVLPFLEPEGAAEEVARQTSENLSSMLQDILRGAPTEIDAINGAIANLAEQNNLQVPVNRTVWGLIKAIPVRGNIKM